MDHFLEGKHLKEVTRIPPSYPHTGSMGGLLGQGVACPLQVTAVLTKLSFSRKAAKAGEMQQPVLGESHSPRCAWKEEPIFLDPAHHQTVELSSMGSRWVKVVGHEVFSRSSWWWAQQNTRRIPNAPKYWALKFHFPTLLAQVKNEGDNKCKKVQIRIW